MTQKKELTFREKFKRPTISPRQQIIFIGMLIFNVLNWLGAPLFGIAFNVQYFVFMFTTTCISYMVIITLRGVEPPLEPPLKPQFLMKNLFKAGIDLIVDTKKDVIDVEQFRKMMTRYFIWGLRDWDILEGESEDLELTQLKQYIENKLDVNQNNSTPPESTPTSETPDKTTPEKT